MLRPSISAALAAALLALPAAGRAQTETAPADSVRLVTRDIPNFWRAYDEAAGRDSAERVRIFRAVYLEPGSPGLHDWAWLRLADRRAVRQRLVAGGWSAATLDSAQAAPPGSALRDSLERARRPVMLQAAAENLVAALAAFPGYYADIRGRSLAVDTSAVVSATVRRGLRRLAELYPEARFPDIYFLIGNLSTGGTVGLSGMLIGTEQYAGGPDTPRDGIPPWFAEILATHTLESLGALVIHEAVHSLQAPRSSRTLLEQALVEGTADFLAELALGATGLADTPRHRYGRAHEREVWLDFRDEMATDSTIRTWMYNGNVPAPANHGATDMGYFVGYVVAREYYERAADKRAAIRELLLMPDPERLLRESAYAERIERTGAGGGRR